MMGVIPFEITKKKEDCNCKSSSKQYCFYTGCPECGLHCEKYRELPDFEYQARRNRK